MKERDMFYQNVNQGYSVPPGIIPPSGYNLNTQYQAYGPNVIPSNMDNNNYEERISRLERQVKNLDTRLQKIENANINPDDNFYMI